MGHEDGPNPYNRAADARSKQGGAFASCMQRSAAPIRRSVVLNSDLSAWRHAASSRQPPRLQASRPSLPCCICYCSQQPLICGCGIDESNSQENLGMTEFAPRAEPRKVTVAATQMACSWDIEDNLVRAPSAELGSRTAAAGAAALRLCTACRRHTLSLLDCCLAPPRHGIVTRIEEG